MNTKNKKNDDLTTIKGIGPTRQEWLRNKLKVSTYHNLASLQPEEVMAQLKLDGLIASQGDVEKWIVQARGLAASEEISPLGVWEPFASFVIEFQTRRGKTGSEEFCTTVQHMEADKDEKWPGIDTEQLCHWMQDRIGKEVPDIKEQVQVTSFTKTISIVVSGVQLFQPPQAARPTAISLPGHSFQGFLKRDIPFELQESFSIIGLDSGDIQNKTIPYYVQFYAHELPLGELIHLGDTEPHNLIDGQTSYRATLPEASLPAGIFLLKVLTRFQIIPPVFSHNEIPMLLVV